VTCGHGSPLNEMHPKGEKKKESWRSNKNFTNTKKGVLEIFIHYEYFYASQKVSTFP